MERSRTLGELEDIPELQDGAISIKEEVLEEGESYSSPAIEISLSKDHLLYCEYCNDFFLDGCSDHPLTITTGRDFLRVKSDGRVFNNADHSIDTSTLLGPYPGDFYSCEYYESSGIKSNASVELYDSNLREIIGYICPGPDLDSSVNSLPLIKTTASLGEGNLTLIQYKGCIYFRVSKAVAPGEELLRNYSQGHQKKAPSPLYEKTFDQKGDLESHAKVSHSEVLDHHCPICRKSFARKGNLAAHVKTIHLKAREFNCPHCKKVFSQKGNLESHIQVVHLQAREYPCLECGKSFSRKGNLDIHFKNIHLNAREHQCPHCSQSFNQKCHRDKHVKVVHLKVRDHICPHCDKPFGIKSGLDTHIKAVHLKVLDHDCIYCTKSFAQKRHLEQHLKSVHLKIRDQECTICGKFFSSKGSLDNHLLMIHLKT